MPRKVTSQWEFPDLMKPADSPSAAASAPEVLSVSQLTSQIRRLLEGTYGTIWVSGEVSNLRTQASGHSYFTLKDASAQLNCVLFRGDGAAYRSLLQDGQKVELKGILTVYEPRGQYQLRVKSVALHGVGALQLAFERLKQKLQAEGLFAEERKRPIPRYPRCVGLVTSPTGAALRDVLHVVARRHPGLELILAPCRVQGTGAAEEVAAAVDALNRWAASGHALDLILVTRGGGSLEDLWAFNEEAVARAIHRSALPVVSAVGHEIDFTISDFVADLRAATPSAAAEIITEGAYASRQFLAEARQRMRVLMRRRWTQELENLSHWRQRLARLHPRRVLDARMQWVDELQGSLQRSVRRGWRQHAATWEAARRRLAALRPAADVARRRLSLKTWQRRLVEHVSADVARRRARWETLHARLRLLGPDNVLARGYSITMRQDTGAVVRAVEDVQPGDLIRTRFRTGERTSRITDGGK